MEIKVVYHHQHPRDIGGYEFYSVTVWEAILKLPNIASWSVPVRILEARMVIRGQIKYHVYEVHGLDGKGNWDHILDYAKTLDEHWMPIFESAKNVGVNL